MIFELIIFGMVFIVLILLCLLPDKKEKECNCNAAVYYEYFWKDGIERKGMYCKRCRILLDYIPQY